MHPTHRTSKALLRQLNEDVANLAEAPLRALIGPMVAAEQELTADLEALVGRMGERYTAQALRNNLLQVRGALNAVQNLRPELRDELAKAGKQGRLLSTRLLQHQVAKFALHFDKTIKPVPLIPATKIAEHLHLERFARAASKYSSSVQADIRRQLTIGMLRGESVGQMAARLTGTGRRGAARVQALPAPQQAKEVSHALWERYRYQARRLVRTEVLHAYNEVAQDQIMELAREEGPGWGKKWVAELDNRVCMRCRALDGKVVPADATFPGCLPSAPPDHPQCRCTVVAWHSRWDEKATRPRGGRLEGPPEAETPPAKAGKLPWKVQITNHKGETSTRSFATREAAEAVAAARDPELKPRVFGPK
jgi:SPP1 gp7 family putative phage head morphogenesis protein